MSNYTHATRSLGATGPFASNIVSTDSRNPGFAASRTTFPGDTQPVSDGRHHHHTNVRKDTAGPFTSSHLDAVRPPSRKRHVSHFERPKLALAVTAPGGMSSGPTQMIILDGPSGGDRSTNPVVLEEMRMTYEQEEGHVIGTVRVGGIVQEKRVIVRFTFDDWTTTSEVACSHISTATTELGVVEHYAFRIRIPERNLESRVLVLAVLCTAGGTEIWDNNSGKNYRARFQAATPLQTRRDRRNSESANISSTLRLNTLALPDFRAAGPEVDSPSPTENDKEDNFDFRSDVPLSKRYNFGMSSRATWRPTSPSLSPSPSSPTLSSPTSPNDHYTFSSRTRSLDGMPRPMIRRSATSYRGWQGIGFSQLALGSPREVDEDAYRTAGLVPLEDDDVPFARPAPKQRSKTSDRGYFDLKRTVSQFVDVNRRHDAGGDMNV
ncbi:hypothetical protein PUNSTDRAFT_127984 [Punctularia strigosozonata HHB-11173 SS5]|uniref:CBM21 domain-containing protein n=1 Tax=Punctularia strigosozonata (strain HHB-11173) TaxID=741275 RepID=R7S4F6_PUNST|nr:uncharacterized protein PUNSTDRAFT_127984 [Punctularia strigosozonata HHB-11173 SS5]EIN05113.1 hypothetical protein PUNSTDRAFT_127984 [Punctularia strigosozonata HHB-11173 SS5]